MKKMLLQERESRENGIEMPPFSLPPATPPPEALLPLPAPDSHLQISHQPLDRTWLPGFLQRTPVPAKACAQDFIPAGSRGQLLLTFSLHPTTFQAPDQVFFKAWPLELFLLGFLAITWLKLLQL